MLSFKLRKKLINNDIVNNSILLKILKVQKEALVNNIFA